MPVLERELDFTDIPLTAEGVCPADDENDVDEKCDLRNRFVAEEFLDDKDARADEGDYELLFEVEGQEDEVERDFLAEVIADFRFGNQKGEQATPIRHQAEILNHLFILEIRLVGLSGQREHLFIVRMVHANLRLDYPTENIRMLLLAEQLELIVQGEKLEY